MCSPGPNSRLLDRPVTLDLQAIPPAGQHYPTAHTVKARCRTELTPPQVTVLPLQTTTPSRTPSWQATQSEPPPAMSSPSSRPMTLAPLMLSGTSPAISRCASPCTIEVLPTPGSPIKTALQQHTHSTRSTCCHAEQGHLMDEYTWQQQLLQLTVRHELSHPAYPCSSNHYLVGQHLQSYIRHR
jgi:hypothetical protein